MEHPLRKLCVVSPWWIPSEAKWRDRRLAIAEPMNGLPETAPFLSVDRKRWPSLRSMDMRSQRLTYKRKLATGQNSGIATLLNHKRVSILTPKGFAKSVIKKENHHRQEEP